MVSSPLSKKEDAAVATASAAAKAANACINKSCVTLALGPKPLAKHRFYLDIKSHLTSSKLEAKIRELGGLLELFLIKEVTHVVTDKEGWTNTNKGGGSIPRTPHTPATACGTEHGTADATTPVRGRPKTRADAMLEKARNTPTICAKDPLEDAKHWGIPIWTVDKASFWLERVLASRKNSINKRKAKVIDLKAPYIKFEAFDRKTRPVFKEIRNWPTFNTHALPGSSGLVHKSPVERTMTRKSVNTAKKQQRDEDEDQLIKVDPATQPGYCEICREDYPQLEAHLIGPKHADIIKDAANFKELDDLIGDGVDIDAFLRLNAANRTRKDASVTSLAHPKMPRTRTSSICDKSQHLLPPLKQPITSAVESDEEAESEAELESGHRLRSRRSAAVAAMTNSCIGMTADEPDTPVKPEGAKEIRELRSTHRNALLRIAEAESDTWESGRPKRACLKQKRTSADERLVGENRPAFYKMEAVTPKPKPTHKDDVTPITHVVDCPESDEEPEVVDDKGLIVKFKRLRTSELKRLNNEAEQFLFPKKDDDSSDDDVEGEWPNTTASTNENNSSILLTSEDDEPLKSRITNQRQADKHNLGQSSSEDEGDECIGGAKRRKRRRTHAEAFILDNQKYYKFETPGSRLRYQGSFAADFPHIEAPLKNNGGLLPVEVKKEEVLIEDEATEEKTIEEAQKMDELDEEKQVKFNFDEMVFSFERIPKSEPWYDTFRRQDQGEEYYTCFSDSGYWKPFLLPYEMGPIQPLDPRICISAYQQIKKQIFEEISSGATSAGCSTPDPTYLEPNNLDQLESNGEDIVIQEKRKKRRKLVENGKNSRKSPRQHASTLAILSTLIQAHKKRKVGDVSLEVIPEDAHFELEENSHEIEAQFEELQEKIPLTSDEIMAQTIENMLMSALNDFHLEKLEINPIGGEDLLATNYKSDAIEILEDYENHKHNESKTGLASPVRRCYSPGKKPGRKKKKKNRTGWPNKNKARVTLKKDVCESVDSSDESLDSSVVLNGVGSKLDESFGEHIMAQFGEKCEGGELGGCGLNGAFETIDCGGKQTKSGQKKGFNKKNPDFCNKNQDFDAENQDFDAKNCDCDEKNQTKSGFKGKMRGFHKKNCSFHEKTQDFDDKNQDFDAKNHDFDAKNQDIDANNQDFDTNNRDFDEKNLTKCDCKRKMRGFHKKNCNFDAKNQDFDANNQDFDDKNQDFDANNQDFDTNNRNLDEKNLTKCDCKRKMRGFHKKNCNFDAKNQGFDAKNLTKCDFKGKIRGFNKKNQDCDAKNQDLDAKNQDFHANNQDFDQKNCDCYEKNQTKTNFKGKMSAFHKKNCNFDEKNQDFDAKNQDCDAKNCDFDEKNQTKSNFKGKIRGFHKKNYNFNEKNQDFDAKNQTEQSDFKEKIKGFNKKSPDFNKKNCNLDEKTHLNQTRKSEFIQAKGINKKSRDLNEKNSDFIDEKSRDVNEKNLTKNDFKGKIRSFNEKNPDLNDSNVQTNDFNERKRGYNKKNRDLNEKNSDFFNDKKQVFNKKNSKARIPNKIEICEENESNDSINSIDSNDLSDSNDSSDLKLCDDSNCTALNNGVAEDLDECFGKHIMEQFVNKCEEESQSSADLSIYNEIVQNGDLRGKQDSDRVNKDEKNRVFNDKTADSNESKKGFNKKNRDLNEQTSDFNDKNRDLNNLNVQTSDFNERKRGFNKKNRDLTDLNDSNIETSDLNETLADVVGNHDSRVNTQVDLAHWENAEKVLSVNKDLQFQPYVRVQKLAEVELKPNNRRLRSSSSPQRTNVKRARRVSPASSPKSPRVLRKPRGRWYRER